MRAIVRAFLADHPILTWVLIATRWLLWLATGHPVAIVVWSAAMLFGRSMPSAVLLAVLADGMVLTVGSLLLHGPARLYWMWAQGARFRRRWPAAFTEAYVQPEFDRAAIFPGNYYSAPDGLRPVLVAPRLSLTPRRFTRNELRWAVRPWSAQNFGEIAAQSGRLAQDDDRVVRADLVRRKHHQRRRWDLVVSFSERTSDPDGGFSVSGDGHTPAASGDGSGAASPSHRSRRSNQANGSSENGNFGAVRSSGQTQVKERWRVVHDVRNRESIWNE